MSAIPAKPTDDAEIVDEVESPEVEPIQEHESAEPDGDLKTTVAESDKGSTTDRESEPAELQVPDQYLADLQRVSAEFSNFRKQADRRNTEAIGRARADLAGRLLPILDACDVAIAQGAEHVVAIRKAALDALEPVGLEVVNPQGDPFDPTLHEAVSHEPADEGENLIPEVVEVVRRGYVWAGRVLRPAMVKVRG